MEFNTGSTWCLRLLLEHNSAIVDFKAAGIQDRHIVDRNHRMIWSEMERHLDPQSGKFSVLYRNELNSQQMNIINTLTQVDKIPDKSDVIKIAELMKKDFQRNCIYLACCVGQEDLTNKAFSVDETLRKMRIMLDCADVGDDDCWEDLHHDIHKEVEAELKKNSDETQSDKVPTGFGSLDYYTDGGIDRGSFVIYSGETSIGKTAAAIQTQLAALEKGLTVVVIGLEMRGVEYVKRMLSLNARQKGYRDMSLLNFSKPTKRGYNYEMYRRTWDEDWQGYNNKYLKMKSIDFNEMKKLFMSAITRFKADVIILDHILLVTGEAREEERIRAGKIANFMKQFAAEHNIVCLGLSQVTRESSKPGQKAKAQNMAGSRDLENAATHIVEFKFWEEEEPERRSGTIQPVRTAVDNENNNMRRAVLTKHRGGIRNVYWKTEYMGASACFEDIESSNSDELRSSDEIKPFKYY